ncbi:phosphoribosylanthranilate isomerase [Cohnella sp.]|uniref:phosphoribosylanthranilate isomerase n=1 Tax=Cohnella sp. TaxID=1883426 RepID=UPI0035669ACF
MRSQGTKVKICGIKEEATLQGMSGLPVDYIGFVFAKSKRQISLEGARKLHDYAKSIMMAEGKPPRTVGVFVNPTLEYLAEVLSEVKLDVVQLHGEETPEFCQEVQEQFKVEVWRALPVTDDDNCEGAAAGTCADRLAAYRNAVSVILLDTAGGGTGKAFRWEVIPSYQAAASQNGLQLFIAGGLSPDNANDLVTTYHPQGVDISSGVESDGVKDIGKITAFAERVRSS